MNAASLPRLADAFPAPDLAAWTAAATAGPTPVPLAKLEVALGDGIKAIPLATPATAPATPALPGQGDRRRGALATPTRTRIAVAPEGRDPADWNASARAAIAGGADALVLDPDPAEGGLLLADPTDWRVALAGIDLARVTLLVRGATGFECVTDLLLPALVDKPHARVALDLDIVGALASTGRLRVAAGDLPAKLAGAARFADACPGARVYAADGRPFHAAGATAAQELGLVLASLVATLRLAAEGGVDPARVPGLSRALLATGPHLGLGIAKVRAFRALAARLVALVGGTGVAPVLPKVHAFTGGRRRTALDASTNSLRASTEAFAALAAGADFLTVDPWDAAARQPTSSSRRLALNTALILRDECHLGEVADPAGGSWHLERLTEDLGAAAWKVFQGIEAKGGILAALRSGEVAALLAKSAAEETERLTRRRDVLVGVNTYADPSEPAPAAVPAAAPAEDGGIAPRPVRIAAGYEALRRRAGALAARRARPARAFLANLGPLRQHQARADFSRGFLEAAGLEVVYPRGFEDPAAAAQAAVEAGADLVVCCSTDDTYPALLPAFVPALRAALPKAVIVVAGAPGDREAADRAAGVDAWIHLRVDHLASLEDLVARVERATT